MALTVSGTNASPNNYRTTVCPVTDYPFTMVAWALTTSAPATRTIFSLGQFGVAETQTLRTTTSSTVQATSINAAGNNSATSSATISQDVWFHAAAVFSSATSRTVYVDGGGSGNNTSSRVIGGAYDHTQFGRRSSSTNLEIWAGHIAEAAIWNVALTAADVAALATGIRPSLVRPDKLVFYSPLVRAVYDARGGLAFTQNGTPGIAVHPRRIA